MGQLLCPNLTFCKVLSTFTFERIVRSAVTTNYRLMKKIYTRFLVFAMAILIVGGMLVAKNGMKDIELDPGKHDNKGNVIKLFPSIVSTEATVHFWFDADGYVTMNVYDIQGRVAASDEGTIRALRTFETHVDAASLQSGTYFVRLTHSNGSSLTSKMVVAH